MQPRDGVICKPNEMTYMISGRIIDQERLQSSLVRFAIKLILHFGSASFKHGTLGELLDFCASIPSFVR